MENKINIAELLEDAPRGIKLYSPLFGEGSLISSHNGSITINSKELDHYEVFFSDGRYYYVESAECLLFPSKDCRTWENFKAPWKRQHFEPFQRVLVKRCGKWVPSIYGHCTTLSNGVVNHVTCDGVYILDDAIIPYEGNEDKLGKEVE